MAKFSVSYNGKIIKTYELEDAVITIGRLPENKICISNMGISRRHAKLERDANNNFSLTDFSSLNGTFVNNKKVLKAVISRGDTITIGKYTIVFEPDEKSVSAPAVIKEQSTDFEAFPADTALKAVPEKEQTSISPEQQKNAGAVPSVLIETNKHVVYKLDKPFITLGASENDDIFVRGLWLEKDTWKLNGKKMNCGYGRRNSWESSVSTAGKRKTTFSGTKTGLKSDQVCSVTWKMGRRNENCHHFRYTRETSRLWNRFWPISKVKKPMKSSAWAILSAMAPIPTNASTL